MPDFIGSIEVPEVAASGTFPLTAEYDFLKAYEPIVVTHQFEAGNGKIEQRFYKGVKARRYRFQKRMMCNADVKALRDFWEARGGMYQPFTLNVPGDSHAGAVTGGEAITTEGGSEVETEGGDILLTEVTGGDGSLTPVTVRFASPVLDLQHFGILCETGLEFIEVPSSTPSYSVNDTLDRFPDSTLEIALESQVQELIPCLTIRVKDPGIGTVYLSDRRVTIDGQLYLERLTDWGPIRQSINGESDSAEFRLGNADRVMGQFAASTRLDFAWLQFSLYHVQTGIMLNVWAGPLAEYAGETALEFHIVGRDPLFDTRMQAPARTISRRCWKRFNGAQCPFDTEGGLDLLNFPSASGDSCDKGFDTPNGCRAHGMDDYHGGHPIFPQKVRFKDNTKGVFGIGRPKITSQSTVTDSVFGSSLPLIFTDIAIPVPCQVVAGRDESEFYAALGLIGEGPLATIDDDGNRLDGYAQHGPGTTGLIKYLGEDPTTDPFALTDLSGGPYPQRAAGTAAIEIRRTDQEGIQIAQNQEHEMIAMVSGGLKVHTWESGVRQAEAVTASPFWAALYVYLRQFGIHRNVLAAVQEARADIASVEACEVIASTVVDAIIGGGTATQFKFVGRIDTKRPVRDLIKDILAHGLGYFTFRNGKIRFGCRADSASLEAFTTGNVIWGSYQPSKFPSEFNKLRVYYNLREVASDGTVTLTSQPLDYEDEDAALEESQTDEPSYRPGELNLFGVVTQDQAARIATVRMREESGGITASDRAKARGHRWESTILGMDAEPGMVASLNGLAGMPEDPAEVRILNQTLYSDFRIEYEGKTTRDVMYDLVEGSTAVDVVPDAPPDEVASQLAADPVTSVSASEDPYIQDDGTVRSLVHVNFAEPSPLGTYRGVKVYGRHYDSTSPASVEAGAATPASEWFYITSFPEEASPTDRDFKTDVTQKVLRLKLVSYNSYFDSDFTSAPTASVLLDGKQSPPTTPTDLWCQHLPSGEKLSWVKNPEDDLAGYKIAYTGDKEPYSLSFGNGAIKPEHVIATVLKSTDASDRNQFLWQQKIYEMDIAGSVLTLFDAPANEWTNDQLLVETSSSVFQGMSLRIFYPDGTSEDKQIVSNGQDSITLTSPPAGTGRVRVRLGGADNEQQFYIAAFDTSGNVSDWGDFPQCSPFAPDGTNDTDYPVIHVPGVPIDTSGFDRASWYCRKGQVYVRAAARSITDADSDFASALKRSINGIVLWQVRITTVEAIGQSEGSGTSAEWTFPASVGDQNFSYRDVIPVIRPDPFWVVANQGYFVIDLPDKTISLVEIRARNSWGWGGWATADAMSSNTSAYTGNGIEQPVVTQNPVSAALSPNVARSQKIKSTLSDATTAINAAERLTSGGTPGTGVTPIAGEEFTLFIYQDATGGRKVTFDAKYIGVRPEDVNQLPNTYTALTFYVETTSRFVCKARWSPVS